MKNLLILFLLVLAGTSTASADEPVTSQTITIQIPGPVFAPGQMYRITLLSYEDVDRNELARRVLQTARAAQYRLPRYPTKRRHLRKVERLEAAYSAAVSSAMSAPVIVDISFIFISDLARYETL